MHPEPPSHDDLQDVQIRELQQRTEDRNQSVATSTDEKWHLDKRVPVAIVVTVLLQAGTGLWFAAKLDARVTALEEAKTLQRERDALQDQAMGQTATLIRADLSYIRGQLDQLLRDQRVEAKPPR